MALVQEALLNWSNYRKGVISEMENIPEEHLDHRMGEGARTIREIALHIILSGVGFTDELLRPEGALMNVSNPENLARIEARYPKARTKEDLLALLRATGDEIQKRLGEAGEALVQETMVTRVGSQSRLSALWFCIAHEGYHRGQLTVCARALGLVPALTQFIHAQARAKTS